jgi:DNA-binding GntR family transcriptional regulator
MKRAPALYTRVYEELRLALMGGRLAPGEVVTWRELAAALGTSVMPVREAVRQLVANQALEILENRSVRVPPLSLENWDEVLQLRLTLEGDACAWAAERMDEATVAALVAINLAYNRAREQGRTAEALEQNRKLHFAIYAAAANRYVLPVIENLWVIAGPYLHFSLQAQESEKARTNGFRHHLDLIEALKQRRASAARRALKADLLDGDVLIRRMLARITS